jgi:hypothetical protein
MKSEVYKRKLDTYDWLFALIFDAAARVKKGEDHFKQQAILAHE